MELNLSEVLKRIDDSDTIESFSSAIQELGLIVTGSENSINDIWNIVSRTRRKINSLNKIFTFEKIKSDSALIEDLINLYGDLISKIISKYGLFDSVNVLIDLWDFLGDFQREANKCSSSVQHIYRAGAAFYIGRLLIDQDPGMSIWWLLLGYIDDLLNDNFNGGAAKDLLRLVYGVSENTFQFLEKQVQNNKNGEGYQRYAEYGLLELALEPGNAQYFSYETSNLTYRISPTFSSELYDAVNEDTTGKNLRYYHDT